MPAIATELCPVTSSISIWQVYDPAVKAELFSTAVLVEQKVFLIDPVLLTDTALADLERIGRVSGVVVTNSNHHRACARFTERFSIPTFAHQHTFSSNEPEGCKKIADGDDICDGLRAIAIDGAAPGEIALHHNSNGGSLIVGDALINFEPYGFTLLPRKYCANEKEMKRSLRKLLDYEVERILFAHGLPILSDASARLRRLLDINSKSAK